MDKGLAAILFVVAAFLLIVYISGRRERSMASRRQMKRLRDLFASPDEKKIPPERLRLIPRYTEHHPGGFQLDDITWNDLDMDQVFLRIDRTLSAAGEEYLYYLLRTPILPPGESGLLEKAVRYYQDGSHETERLELQKKLDALGHTDKYSLYDYLSLLDNLGERNPNKQLLHMLLPAAALLVMVFTPQMGVLLLIAAACFNIATYFREKRKIEPYIVSFRYIERLISFSLRCAPLLPDVFAPEKKTLDETARKDMAAFSRASFLLNMGNNTGNGDLLGIVMDYLRMMFHLDLWKFDQMLKELKNREDSVDRMITAAGRIDATVSVASFRESLPAFCVPEFTDSSVPGFYSYNAKGLYHPMLPDPVPNDLSAVKPILLTGSNASGKSTFLKAVALSAVTAQTINTVCADSYRAPRFMIFTSMALKDSITGGESYFMAEIRSLKRIMDAAADSQYPVLGCIDEVLRGTNTIERIAASAEVLLSLSGSGAFCITATHDLELADLLSEHYDNYHFTETIADGDVQFYYKLLPGKTDTRNAILLLSRMGFDDSIIRRALERAAHFEKTNQWK